MDLYVIRRPSAWANLQELEAAGAKSAKIGNEEMSDRVRWIRGYVVKEPDCRFGSVCIYEARDPESIRAHARLSECPAIRSSRSSRPSSSARTRKTQAKLPESASWCSTRGRAPCSSPKAAPHPTARAA
jgi:Protein of unknown function (DUF4242)